MSEYINNQELRQNTMKDIIRQLHEGKNVDEVKKQFADVFEGVSATEISKVEGALVEEGLAVEEIQKLCDVHASIFGESIEEIHQESDFTKITGHPLHILKLENRELERIIQDEIKQYSKEITTKQGILKVVEGLTKLSAINLHYQKKENQFFPYMEKYGITAPPKVMWGVDDEIRTGIKEIKALLLENAEQGVQSKEQEIELKEKLEEALKSVEEMIFKEENIMIPMLLEHLQPEDWDVIAEGSNEIGYIIDPVPEWTKKTEARADEKSTTKADIITQAGVVTLPSGVFKVEELVQVLNTLPFDITFVDKDDKVAFFSEGKERTFPRTKAIIGRNVSNCHPPSSVHIVEKIVEDFKNKKKDQEDFWIKAGNKYILIRYYAVRSEAGEYLGVLEVTQDIKPIQEIVGEKRLLEE